MIDHGFADRNCASLLSILRVPVAAFRSSDPRVKAAPKVSSTRRLQAGEQAELAEILGGQVEEEAAAEEEWTRAVQAHYLGSEAAYLQRSYGELMKRKQDARRGKSKAKSLEGQD